jgi:crotonobetainyl-CoA:carnitine CoA-transferase CaiB-like acyl-CoA transferase
VRSATTRSAALGKGPLAGVRVLDLTEHMAGPYCTAILADMGADVVKIERPGKGDSIREQRGNPRNPQFLYINRNKQSLTLDYKQPEGKAILLKLVRGADVLVENYRPTVMERAGLGYDVLIRANPRLVYASLSGFGYDGPYRQKGGFDLIAQAFGGIMHVTGETDGPPTSVGLPICDLGTGMWGVQGILAALLQRGRTGRGQRVECSLMETAIAFSSWTSANWFADRTEPTRQGSRHRQSAPYQRFTTQDGYLVVGAGNQKLFERFSQAVGHPEWPSDPRFASGGLRMKNRAALEAAIEAVFRTASTAHWQRVLEAAGIPCGPVNTYAQLFSDPQVLHRGMVVNVPDAELGSWPHLRMPVRLSEGEIAVRHTAPKLGEHTAEILAALGYSPAQQQALAAKQVL